MKSLVMFFCAALASCTSVPKQPDPFDAAIAQSMGAMMGGIVGMDASSNEGGVR